MNLRIFATYLVVFMLAFTSCKSSKISVADSNSKLKIEQAYIQKEVPGLPNMQARFYLNIVFNAKSLDGVKLDSIKMTGAQYTVLSKGNFLNISLNQIRLGIKPLPKIDKNEPNGAILYFHKNNQAYYQLINEILIKEPLFLP
ncbi:MAG: hypothetical protein KDC83_14810 [Flavobacteriales bacterium]|nr:hypothetical protein [Flavobacteriales bacterium]